MCHFCEDVWNLAVGFHTIARCTTGTVSPRGSRGRCFFNVGVAGMEVGAAGRVAVDNEAAPRTTGEVAGRGTMVTGMTTSGGEDWEVAPEEVAGAAAVFWDRETGGGWALPTWKGGTSEVTQKCVVCRLAMHTFQRFLF